MNDKAGQFFGRQEAPLVTLGGLETNETYVVLSGLIPNRRGTPLVDEWFVLQYVDGTYQSTLSMDDLMKRTGFGVDTLPNAGKAGEAESQLAEQLLPDVIQRANEYMMRSYKAYKDLSDDQVLAELDKLMKLEQRHKEHIREKYEQLSFAGKERRKDQEERKIDEIFKEFYTWVKESMEIQDKPYLRVIAVFQGVRA